ncbi:MAG: hypothetical protein JST04_04590 [Bdellovibrionales bacterium]|nr:hypothetical protein [Bdellovibrionales bacterium]
MVHPKSRPFWLIGLLLSLSASVSNAWAWPPTFGAEFTFTNTEMLLAQLNYAGMRERDEWKKAWAKKDWKAMVELIDWNTTENDTSNKYLAKMKDSVMKRCKQCKLIEGEDHYGKVNYRFVYPDGWWFQIATDPAVIEIQTAPTTRADFEKMRDRLQTDIFGSAKSVGMMPEPIMGIGQGHIHMGLDAAFENDPKLFRNFLVDMMNHPEVNFVFGRNERNAAILSDLGLKNIQEFKKLIADFDAGKIRAIRSLATALQKRVYTKCVDKWWSPPEKYQAINVTRTVDPKLPAGARTVEFRSHRPQKSADEFLDQIRVYEARVEYLRGLKEPIKVNIPTKDAMSSAKEVVRRFRDFIVQSGLNWAKNGAPLIRGTSYVREATFLREANINAFTAGVGNLLSAFAAKCRFLFRPFSLEQAKLTKPKIDPPPALE